MTDSIITRVKASDIQALIERLEKAEAGDRELDALIWCYFAGVKYKAHFEPYGGDARTQVDFTLPPARKRLTTSGQPRAAYPHALPFTSSVDAAIALARRLFPECTITIDAWPEKANARLSTGVRLHPDYPELGEGWGANPAIATVLAILKAHQQQGEGQ